jgi:hypothetical protein
MNKWAKIKPKSIQVQLFAKVVPKLAGIVEHWEHRQWRTTWLLGWEISERRFGKKENRKLQQSLPERHRTSRKKGNDL